MTVFRVYINWDGTGIYSPADEITDDIQEMSWSLGNRRAYQLVADESMASFTVRNTDGKYTFNNPLSPLYGLIKPQRRCKIEAEHNAVTVILWSGFLDLPIVEWKPSGLQTGKTVATLQAVGAKQLIERVNINLGIYTDTTGDVIVHDALVEAGVYPSLTGVWLLGNPVLSALGETTSLAGLPSSWSNIDEGTTVFTTYGDNSRNAWQVITDITGGERGWFFFGRDGRANWQNRNHRIIDIVNAIELDNDNAPAYGLIDVNPIIGANLANILKVEMTPRQVGTSQILWELDSPITINAGESSVLQVRLRKDGGQFVGASDLTPAPTWASGTGTITVSPRGGRAIITIENTTANVSVLSALTLSGSPTQSQNSFIVEKTDNISIGEHGIREHKIDIQTGGNYADAIQIALFELYRRSSLILTIESVLLREVPDNAMTTASEWAIDTRVNIDLPELYHNAGHWVVGESHKWVKGNKHEGRYFLEPAGTSAFWLLGVAEYGELGETTILTY